MNFTRRGLKSFLWVIITGLNQLFGTSGVLDVFLYSYNINTSKLFVNMDKAVTLIFSTSTLLLFSVHCVNFSFILSMRKLSGKIFCALAFVTAASWGEIVLY